MLFDLNDFSAVQAYHLLTQTVIPRPIAWVLTKNDDQQSYNLAPFSYFTAISSAPPLLLFSCSPKNETGELKDTAKNSLQQQSFVIHIANDQQMQAVQDTAKPLAYGESELSQTTLSLTDFEGTQLQRIKQAPIAIACKLHQHINIGDAPQTLIIGEVTHVYIADHLVEIDDSNQRIRIDADNISPLSRLGMGGFASFGKTIKPST